MTRVLIVDDELIVRIGIRSMIDWEQNGFKIVGEAGDGMEALEQIRALSPHIVLTDIKMPRMDGIDLIRHIKEERLPVKVVVLSCYNEFDYVKKTLKMGASDYVLKLSMQPQDLLSVIQAVKEELLTLPVAHLAKSPPVPDSDNWLADVRKVLLGKEDPAEDAVPAPDGSDLLPRFQVFCVRVFRKQSLPADITETPRLLHAAQILLGDVLEPRWDHRSFLFDPNTIVSAIRLQPGHQETQSALTEQLLHAQQLIETHLNCYSNIGVEWQDHDIRHLRDAFLRTLQACVYGFYFQQSTIFTPPEAQMDGSISQLFDFAKIRGYFEALNAGNIEQMRGDLRLRLDELMALRNVHPRYVRKECKNILHMIHMSFLSQDFAEEAFQASALPDVSQIDQVGYLEQIKTILLRALETYQTMQSSKVGGNHNKMRELREFLKLHASKKVTLDMAAGFVNLSRNYFCSVFKLEFGMTFNDYLTEQRMDAAKKLLRTSSLSIGEIADQVGYDNPNYFFTIFRKHTGVSPNQYRNRRKEDAAGKPPANRQLSSGT